MRRSLWERELDTLRRQMEAAEEGVPSGQRAWSDSLDQGDKVDTRGQGLRGKARFPKKGGTKAKDKNKNMRGFLMEPFYTRKLQSQFVNPVISPIVDRPGLRMGSHHWITALSLFPYVLFIHSVILVPARFPLHIQKSLRNVTQWRHQLISQKWSLTGKIAASSCIP